MTPLKLATSHDVAFSPDGSLLATDDDRCVFIWDLLQRKKMLRFRPFPWAGVPQFSPDGTRLALKSTSGRIGVVDVASGKTLADFENEADGEGCRVTWSADGRFLVDGSWTGRLMVREWDSGECVFVRDHPGEMIDDIHRSADGATWVVVHGTKWQEGMPTDQPLPPDSIGVRGWPFADRAERVLTAQATHLQASGLSTDGELLAVVHSAGMGRPQSCQARLSVFSVRDDALLGSVDVGEGTRARHLAWSPDGRVIAAALEERRPDPDAPPRDPAAPPWISTGFKSVGVAVFWDSVRLGEVRRIEVDCARAVAFSPSGGAVAICGAPGVVVPVDF